MYRGEVPMAADALARNWWLFVLRGVLAVLFGVVALVLPNVTLVALVLLFGAYALVDGILAVAAGIRKRESEPRWWVLILEGMAGMGLGILTFIWPHTTALVLLYMIAAWAILTVILEVSSSIRLRKEIQGEFWLALGGILSVGFGILLIVFPGAGALSVVWLIGAYAVVFGVVFLLLALRLRGWKGAAKGPTSQPV